MLDMLRMLCMLCVLHVLCMLSTLYGCPEADSIGRDGDLRCTEWGWGGAGAVLTEVPRPRSKDCSTLRLRPVAVGIVAAAKHGFRL